MIIIEGKLEDLSKKYIPQFDKDRGRFIEGLTPESVIEHLYVSDPSPTKKYFEWMIKQCLDMIAGNFTIGNDIVARMVRDVQIFDENINKIDDDFLTYNEEKIGNTTYRYLSEKPLRDINTYTFTILRKIISYLEVYNTKNERRRLAKEGATLVYENEKYKVYEIDTYIASCFYGAGSKWCTTDKDSDSHFKSYGTGNKKLLYVISKTKTKETDPIFYKIAINIKYDNNQITFWDAPDKSFDGWTYFNTEDPNILNFLISYVKEKDPENYHKMLPEEYLTSIKQKEEGLTDLQLISTLEGERATKWLSYKYNLKIGDAIVKKLDLLKGNVTEYLGDWFTNGEKSYLIRNKENLLEPRELTWMDFIRSYHQLAITTEYSPSEFINSFLGGDKNKALEIGKNDLTILYWLARGGKYIEDLGRLYGAEKLFKYIIKNKTNPIFSLTSILPGLLTNETPKKRKELYEMAYKFDGKDRNYSFVDYFLRQVPKETFIASFNKGDGNEIEPTSYGRAFLYLKQNEPESIGRVFEVGDINKIFKSQEKAFSYFLKNYGDFIGDLSIENLVEVFNVEVPESIYGKYMSNWEKRNVTNLYEINEGSRKLFNFILKKFSFKKLADIIGYDGVFKLFCIVNFKKGINYMIENKVGDIKIDDIKIKNGEPILLVNDRTDYAFLFKDENLAEKILGDNLDWDPYNDTFYNWYDDVWGCVNSKSIQYIKSWIKENITEYENEEGENIDIGDTFLNEISDDDLGGIIDEYDEFGELKKEMGWAYDSAYNSAAQSDIIENTQNELETYLGEYSGYEPYKITKRVRNSETGGYESKEYTEYRFLYDLGDSLYEILRDYSINNWGYTVDYDTYFSSLLKESEPKKLYIETESYPDSLEVCENFNDDLPGRI
jgi:hypothetical protein